MKRLRTRQAAAANGKVFCDFLALIVASEIEIELQEIMKRMARSKEDVIEELEKIRLAFANNGSKLISPLTKTRREIFDAFDLKEDDLASYVKEADAWRWTLAILAGVKRPDFWLSA